MSEHENMPKTEEQEESTETVEDLDVPEGQAADVGGGVTLNWKKVEDEQG